MNEETEYTLTPLGLMCLYMPIEVAQCAWSALQDRAARYCPTGTPAILCNGKGGSFIKLEVPKC